MACDFETGMLLLWNANPRLLNQGSENEIIAAVAVEDIRALFLGM